MGRVTSGLRRHLGRFWRGEDAAIIAEAVIVLPLLIWAYIGLFVYWDAFRSLNTVQKAAYTVSDVLSRDLSHNGITSAYVDGLHKVVDYLINHEQNSTMRVTSVYWSSGNNRFEVHWSRTTDDGSMPPLTTATLQNYLGQIPTMNAGNTEVIVEVRVPYVPAFNVGLPNQVFSEFIVTRPRFQFCIIMDGIACPVG
jgi:Flp pilus assembly protein TadG